MVSLCKVWDVYLSEGEEFLVAVCLGILRMFAARLSVSGLKWTTILHYLHIWTCINKCPLMSFSIRFCPYFVLIPSFIVSLSVLLSIACPFLSFYLLCVPFCPFLYFLSLSVLFFLCVPFCPFLSCVRFRPSG